jgi:hypothetical protein
MIEPQDLNDNLKDIQDTLSDINKKTDIIEESILKISGMGLKESTIERLPVSNPSEILESVDVIKNQVMETDENASEGYKSKDGFKVLTTDTMTEDSPMGVVSPADSKTTETQLAAIEERKEYAKEQNEESLEEWREDVIERLERIQRLIEECCCQDGGISGMGLNLPGGGRGAAARGSWLKKLSIVGLTAAAVYFGEEGFNADPNAPMGERFQNAIDVILNDVTEGELGTSSEEIQDRAQNRPQEEPTVLTRPQPAGPPLTQYQIEDMSDEQQTENRFVEEDRLNQLLKYERDLLAEYSKFKGNSDGFFNNFINEETRSWLDRELLINEAEITSQIERLKLYGDLSPDIMDKIYSHNQATTQITTENLTKDPLSTSTNSGELIPESPLPIEERKSGGSGSENPIIIDRFKDDPDPPWLTPQQSTDDQSSTPIPNLNSNETSARDLYQNTSLDMSDGILQNEDSLERLGQIIASHIAENQIVSNQNPIIVNSPTNVSMPVSQPSGSMSISAKNIKDPSLLLLDVLNGNQYASLGVV